MGSAFQSTLPYGERLSGDFDVAFICYFNPRLRMESDPIYIDDTPGMTVISIHAPVWRATPHQPKAHYQR
ncbi:hypothetical protein [Paenibacillus sp. GCM10012306]|uniref:hypothetical protein n=1 Tax=Paenibacillus sp. GCM10012306 TaxID=3317342 RepID=UPI003614F286